jgi:DNA-binding GntR family transcriptional regulator
MNNLLKNLWIQTMDPVQIYAEIKEKIIWLELAPESTLNLTELTKKFKVSRTPISIALTRLETEGWIIRHGTQYVVYPLSLERIKSFTEIRLLMEVQANIWALQRITPEELESLLSLKEKIMNTFLDSSPREQVNLDVEFHNQIFRIAKNKELEQILNRILCHFLRFFLSTPNIIKQDVLSVFVGIIEAIENKDEEKLKRLSINHIQETANTILKTR